MISNIRYLFVISILLIACEKEYFPQQPPPKTAKQTATLEASYTTTPPITLTDAFWKTADYLKAPVTNLNTDSLYPDGMLNMTGTFKGTTTFNNGTNPNVVMKAAYDNNKLYLYIEWIDSDISAANHAAQLNAPADPLKTDTTNGYTSQGNSDKVALAFDIANATSAAGTFVDKGCAATCHNNKMQTLSGSADIWNWDLAISEPLGYAKDMTTDATSGLTYDAGITMEVSNKTTPANPRSAPAYEWDGVEQTLLRPDGKSTTLDPAYYLINKTPFTGDIVNGDNQYHNAVYGCAHCHGDDGNGVGPTGEGTAFNVPGVNGKYSRAAFKTFSAGHTGSTYWAQVPVGSQDDLIAYIKALGSLPGYYLTTPAGSSADVWSISNVTRSRINTFSAHTLYKVLLVRNLTTPNADDVQFTSPEGKTYPFGIALMDNDGKNHIGSLKQTLTFKPKI